MESLLCVCRQMRKRVDWEAFAQKRGGIPIVAQEKGGAPIAPARAKALSEGVVCLQSEIDLGAETLLAGARVDARCRDHILHRHTN